MRLLLITAAGSLALAASLLLAEPVGPEVGKADVTASMLDQIRKKYPQRSSYRYNYSNRIGKLIEIRSSRNGPVVYTAWRTPEFKLIHERRWDEGRGGIWLELDDNGNLEALHYRDENMKRQDIRIEFTEPSEILCIEEYVDNEVARQIFTRAEAETK